MGRPWNIESHAAQLDDRNDCNSSDYVAIPATAQHGKLLQIVVYSKPGPAGGSGPTDSLPAPAHPLTDRVQSPLRFLTGSGHHEFFQLAVAENQ